MIKSLIILFNTIAVFLFSFLFNSSSIIINGNFPKTVKANAEFIAEITINKGDINGFSKLKFEVPNGFTVKEFDSKLGTFSFQNNVAIIDWDIIPNNDEFTVKFIVVPDSSVVGIKNIKASLSYIKNNNKETVEMVPAEISISNYDVKNSLSDNETPEAGNPQEPASQVTCVRQISKSNTPNGFKVDVKIKKGNIKGFAKFQETLPIGCTAKAIVVNGSSFSISDGKLKFVWVELPNDDELLISYLLVRSNLTPIDAKLEVGEFSYLENNLSKKFNLSVDLVNDQPYTNVFEDMPPKIVEPLKVKTEKPLIVMKKNNDSIQNINTKKTNENRNTNNSILVQKEGNVSYLVQIGAFKALVNSTLLAKKFKLAESIKSEMIDGYHKFMVGNNSEYKKARVQRDEIKLKGCTDAFVVAYNGSKRITVQEALMITNQKWFK